MCATLPDSTIKDHRHNIRLGMEWKRRVVLVSGRGEGEGEEGDEVEMVYRGVLIT